MTPAISTTFGPPAQGRPSRDLDTATGGEQTFGALLDDIAQDTSTQAVSTAASPTPGTAPDVEGATVGLANPASSAATALSTVGNAIGVQSSPNTSAGGTAQPGIHALLARVTLTSTSAPSQATGPTGSIAGATIVAPFSPPRRDGGSSPSTATNGAPAARAATAALPPGVGRAATAAATTTSVAQKVANGPVVQATLAETGDAGATSGLVVEAVPVSSAAIVIKPLAPGQGRAASAGGPNPGADDPVLATGNGVDPATLPGAAAGALPFALPQAQPSTVGTPATACDGRLAAATSAAASTAVQQSRAFRPSREPQASVRTSALAAAPHADPSDPAAAPPAAEGDIAPTSDPPAVTVTLVDAASHSAPARPLPSAVGGSGQPASAPAEQEGSVARTVAEVAAPSAGDTATERSGDSATPSTGSVPAAAPTSLGDGAAAAAAARTIANAVTTLASQVSDAPAAAAMPRTDNALPNQLSGPAPARSLTLQLNPADLGSVTVRLALRDGALDVHLAVDDQETLGLITHAREALSAAIGDGATPLGSLVIQGGDAMSPRTAGSHDLAYSNGGASAGHNAGDSGTGGRGAGGDTGTQRQSRGAPTRDPSAADARGPAGLFV